MSDNVYKVTEVVGSSTNSIEEAIQNEVARTAKTVSHVEWFQVIDTRGHVTDGRIAHYQVVLKIGFRLEE